jgi:hypothetical protein
LTGIPNETPRPSRCRPADFVYPCRGWRRRRIDIFLADDLKQSVALVANSSVKFSPAGLPDTTLELRLIAPEPVIFDLIETTAGDRTPAVVGRIKLPVPGASVAVAGLKAAGFHQPYVLVRRD